MGSAMNNNKQKILIRCLFESASRPLQQHLLNHTNLQGQTPLMIAVKCGSIDIVKFLHTNGSDINRLDFGRVSPLSLAGRHGHLEIFQYLHAQGADIHNTLIDGRSVIHLVAQYEHTHIFNYLLEIGVIQPEDLSTISSMLNTNSGSNSSNSNA